MGNINKKLINWWSRGDFEQELWKYKNLVCNKSMMIIIYNSTDFHTLYYMKGDENLGIQYS